MTEASAEICAPITGTLDEIRATSAAIDAIFVRMCATGEQTSVTCARTGEKELRGRNCVLIVATLDPTHATSAAIVGTFAGMFVIDVGTFVIIGTIDAKGGETS